MHQINNDFIEKIGTALFKDNTIVWKPYTPKDIVCKRFSIAEWNLIVTDIDTDADWRDLLLENPEFICCKLLYTIENHTAIGFVYIMVEDEHKRILSIHGGGWEKSTKSSILYYRGFLLMVLSLTKLGYKVRTSCLKNNNKAYRFIRSSGFVHYRTSDTMCHFWTNTIRIRRNKYFKWIHRLS